MRFIGAECVEATCVASLNQVYPNRYWHRLRGKSLPQGLVALISWSSGPFNHPRLIYLLANSASIRCMVSASSWIYRMLSVEGAKADGYTEYDWDSMLQMLLHLFVRLLNKNPAKVETWWNQSLMPGKAWRSLCESWKFYFYCEIWGVLTGKNTSVLAVLIPWPNPHREQFLGWVYRYGGGSYL